VRRVLLLAVLAVLGASAPAAQAAVSAPTIAIADQKPGMFDDPLFADLGVRHARYVVPWDAMYGGFQREELFAWLRAARAAGVTPLLSFGHSRRPGREKLTPSPKALQREFRRIRINFPWVTEWVTWNEPNHCSQPLCHRPELAARYFDAITRACRSCTILGAEVLDMPNMRSWVRRFRAAATNEPKAWGLHNYIDANRFGTKGTRRLLAATRGQVWFTETGGIVNRTSRAKIPFDESPRHAANATRWVFDRLAPLSSRIRRVYLYHWDPAGPRDSWDSALLNRQGQPREAFRVAVARVQRARAAAKRAAARR
jgi:hypothetical protein